VLIALGVVFVFALVRRENSLATSVAMSVCIALLASLPFLLNIFNTLGTTSADEANIGKNFISTHRVILEKVLLVPLLFISGLWLFLRRRPIALSREFIFLVALLIAGLIASNQQVLTGMEIQQHHFHFMTNIPIFLLSGATICWYLLQTLLSEKVAIRNILAAFIIASVVAHAVGIQVTSYTHIFDEMHDRQRWASAFVWLNTNTTKKDVVLANPEVSETIPIYTHDYVYGALHAATYPVSVERLAHNYFMTIFLDGVRGQDARQYLTEHRNEVGQYIFEGQYWRANCGSFGCFPESIFEKLVADYQNFAAEPFEQNLKKYKIDYIIWDKKRESSWQLDQYSLLRKVFDENSMALYRVL